MQRSHKTFQRAVACAHFAVLALLVLVGDAMAASTAAAPPLDAVHVEAFTDGAVLSAMRKDHIAGVSVAIIRGPDILLAKGYGLAAPGRPADGDTLFRVGSISKIGTWIALMQLVQQGRISLDDPINAHLPPDLQIPDESFKEPIRIRNLMSHNAGFEDSVFGQLFVFDANKLLTQEAYLSHYRVHRVRPAGALAVYSNYGAGLAGSIVARVSGEDWPSYAEEHILRPLGMTGATYRDPYPAALALAHHLAAPMPSGVATHVTHSWKFENSKLVEVPYEYVSQIASAGALSMSAKDAAHYMMALLNPALMEQAGVLKVATFETMKEPSFANDPRLGKIRHGLFTYELGGGRWAFGHDGGLVSHFSDLEVSPGLGVGVFVSVNTRGEAASFPDNFERAFFREFFPLAKQTDAAAPRDAMAMARRYAGAYRTLRRAYFRTEAGFESLLITNVTALPDGDLSAGGLLGSARRLHPLGGGLYRVVGEDSRVGFGERDGRMLLFDSFGANPAERVNYFEGLTWFSTILILGLFTAAWGTASGIRRIALGKEKTGTIILDGLCLVWLIGLVLLLMALVPMISDVSVVFTNYPNPVVVSAVWLLLLAAIATPLAPLAVAFLARPRDWSWWRWARVALALVVLAALALTLWQHHLLGFSDWA